MIQIYKLGFHVSSTFLMRSAIMQTFSSPYCTCNFMQVEQKLTDSYGRGSCNSKCVIFAGTSPRGYIEENIKKAPSNIGNKDHRLLSGQLKIQL